MAVIREEMLVALKGKSKQLRATQRVTMIGPGWMYKVRKRRTRIKESRNLAQATKYIVMFHDGRGQSR